MARRGAIDKSVSAHVDSIRAGRVAFRERIYVGIRSNGMAVTADACFPLGTEKHVFVD